MVLGITFVLDMNICTAESLESHSKNFQPESEPPVESLKHFAEPIAVMRAKDAVGVAQRGVERLQSMQLRDGEALSHRPHSAAAHGDRQVEGRRLFDHTHTEVAGILMTSRMFPVCLPHYGSRTPSAFYTANLQNQESFFNIFQLE